MESSNFIPKISENSVSMIKNRPPIHKRVEELQKEKLEVISKLRTSIEAKSESNFKPRINSNSSRIASKRSNFSTEKTSTNAKLAEQLKLEAESFTFAPQTTGNTVNIKGFLERQEEFLKRKEQKIQEKIVKEEIYTFQPVINQNSKYISQDIGPNDKFERMGKQEFERIQQKKAKIQEDYYAKYSHEPKINPSSKYMCKNHSVSEYKPTEYPENEKSFSFQPKIDTNKKFAKVKSFYSDPEKILQKIEEKEKLKQQKMLSIKQENEEKAVKDCTFAPKLTELTEQKEVVLVPGLDRFIELKNLSKKHEEEKKAREHKAFGIKNNSNYVTVQQPFNLAPDTKKETIGKIKQKVDETLMKECTFKPKTLES